MNAPKLFLTVIVSTVGIRIANVRITEIFEYRTISSLLFEFTQVDHKDTLSIIKDKDARYSSLFKPWLE